MNIEIEKTGELGYYNALHGNSLSHGLTEGISFQEFLVDTDLVKRAKSVCNKLAFKGNGHNNFLEQIKVWFILKAPRYFWQEWDTYRFVDNNFSDVCKRSGSTVHTLLKKELNLRDFVEGTSAMTINTFSKELTAVKALLKDKLIYKKDAINKIKKALPEGYLQTRHICADYSSLQSIANQRKGHSLYEWEELRTWLKDNLNHPELVFRNN